MYPDQSALFSLFHHNVDYHDDTFDFSTNDLYREFKKSNNLEIKDIADHIYSIILENSACYKDSEITLMLTGGLDSRVILAAMFKAGIKPVCLTYGNSGSRDVTCARTIAKAYNLNFHNPYKDQPDKNWYYKWVIETIRRDNGNAHLHRAHRTYAIAEHKEYFDTKVLFTGHMGGEGLRGLTYNNYYSSYFFKLVNEKRKDPYQIARNVLNDYFIRSEKVDIGQLIKIVNELPWMKHDKEVNKLYYLYDLIAKLHHAQDIRIYKSYINNVITVFLEKSYLKILFRSRYNFLFKGAGLMTKLRNPFDYCKIIEYLQPELLDFQLSNGYTPAEYLKGLWYYIPVKLYRKKLFKNSYPSSFSYGKWYEEFIREHAHNIDPWIWDHYNRDEYFKSLKKNDHRTDEGYWHKFSNPVFFDLVNKYRTGKI